MADTIISRAQAMDLGLKKYFTGKPCKRGHVAERFVTGSRCLICNREITQAYRAANPLKMKASGAAYRAANREKMKEKGAAYRAANPERERARYDANPEREKARWAAYRAANREKIRASAKARYAANSEKEKARRAAYDAANPEKNKARHAAYRAANPEKTRAATAAYRAANPEKVKAKEAEYRAANPEKMRALCRNRRARILNAGGFHTAEDIQRIYRSQKGKCACCGVKVGKKYEVDHIQPISKGGSNWPRNLQILCRPCNSRKRAKDPVDFSREMGLLL